MVFHHPKSLPDPRDEATPAFQNRVCALTENVNRVMRRESDGDTITPIPMNQSKLRLNLHYAERVLYHIMEGNVTFNREAHGTSDEPESEEVSSDDTADSVKKLNPKGWTLTIDGPGFSGGKYLPKEPNKDVDLRWDMLFASEGDGTTGQTASLHIPLEMLFAAKLCADE